jgi:hypothetical protein
MKQVKLKENSEICNAYLIHITNSGSIWYWAGPTYDESDWLYEGQLQDYNKLKCNKSL